MLDYLFIPEIMLTIGLLLIILIDLFSRSERLSYLLMQLLLILTIYSAINNQDLVYNYASYDLNEFTNSLKIIILVGSLIIFHYSYKHLAYLKSYQSEYLSISVLGLLGTMVMISAKSLLMLYLGIELLSLSLYALIGFNKKSPLSSEAAIKYYILGAMSSGILLFGISLIYGFTGSILYDEISRELAIIDNQSVQYMGIVFGIVFITASVCFKFGAAPFHMWVPDIYQGSLVSTTVLLSTLPKIGVFIVFLKLYYIAFISIETIWSDILIFVGTLSIIIGSIFALSQTNIKRLLAYSAISNIGFIILSLGLPSMAGLQASFYYAIIYTLTALASFGIITHITVNSLGVEDIRGLSGLSKTHPFISILILITMLSSAGIPPLIGFHAKLIVIQSIIDSSMIWLAVIVVLMTVISAYYYLKVIKTIFFDERIDLISIIPGNNFILTVNVTLLLILGIIPSIVYNLSYSIISTLAL